MISRCYSGRNKAYENVYVDTRWLNFSNFYEDIFLLENFHNWNLDKNKRNCWELDKDILCKANKIYPKKYSKETCKFIPQRKNKIQAWDEKLFNNIERVGCRISDGFTDKFKNANEFARKYNLRPSGIHSCFMGIQQTHRGWLFFKDKHSYDKFDYIKYKTEYFKKIICIDILNNKIYKFKDIKSASKILGINKGFISRCLDKKRRKTKNLFFKYSNDKLSIRDIYNDNLKYCVDSELNIIVGKFININDFSRENNLNATYVSKCLNKKMIKYKNLYFMSRLDYIKFRGGCYE